MPVLRYAEYLVKPSELKNGSKKSKLSKNFNVTKHTLYILMPAQNLDPGLLSSRIAQPKTAIGYGRLMNPAFMYILKIIEK